MNALRSYYPVILHGWIILNYSTTISIILMTIFGILIYKPTAEHVQIYACPTEWIRLIKLLFGSNTNNNILCVQPTVMWDGRLFRCASLRAPNVPCVAPPQPTHIAL